MALVFNENCLLSEEEKEEKIIWCNGCLENRQDLSYSAPGFEVT